MLLLSQLQVSAAISKLTEASERSSRESSPILKKNGELNSPRGIKRGTNFSQLLQKFSGSDASSSEKSDTDTQSPRGRKNLLRRQEACAVSSQSSDDARRTPERTQSLRVKPTSSTSSEKESSVQRSSSFKSDFMKRRYSPEPEVRRRLPSTPSSEQSDKPTPELAEVLNKRSQIVAKQQEVGEDVERRRIHDGRVEKADRYSSAGNDKVIADSEVLRMLQSRRKETDSSIDNSSVSEMDFKSQTIVQHVTSEEIKPSESAIHHVKSSTQDRPLLRSQSSYESKASITLSPTSSKEVPDSPVLEQNKPQTASVPKIDLSSVDTSITSLNVSKTVTDNKSDGHDTFTQAATNINLSSRKDGGQIIGKVESDIKLSEIKPISLSKIDIKTEDKKIQKDMKEKSVGKIEVKADTDKVEQPFKGGFERKEIETDSKIFQPAFEKDFRQQTSSTSVSSGTIDIMNKSEIIRKISTRERTPEKQLARKAGPMKVISPVQAPAASGMY